MFCRSGPSFVLLLFLLLLVVVAGSLGVQPCEAATPESSSEVESSTAARELFLEHRCDTCHAVADAEIEATAKSEKMLGPDLSGYGTDDPESLGRYLRKEEPRDGEDHKKEYKGTEEELVAMLAWLGGLVPPSNETAEDGSASDGR